MCCWGSPLLSFAKGICQNNSYILRQWAGTSLESVFIHSLHQQNGQFQRRTGNKAPCTIPRSSQSFFLHHSRLEVKLAVFFPEILQAWKIARSSSHTQFSSSLWERARKHLHVFGVHEGRYRNITLCNYWAVMALFLNYIFQTSLHFSKSTRCKSALSCKTKTSKCRRFISWICTLG